MFRHASIAYIAIALTGIAVLSLLSTDPGPVPVGELGSHTGEDVVVEGTVVAIDGDRTVLWDDGATVDAYGSNPYGHGDRVSARGYVSTGRSVYLNVDSYSLIRKARSITITEARDGSWVECSGRLFVIDDSVDLDTGQIEVPLAIHIDIEPISGADLSLEGLFHNGLVHVYDRSCIGSEDVLASPWMSVGLVDLQGIVAMEPSGASLSLSTIDGTIRVVCNTTGVHMMDLVNVSGLMEYDRDYGRFAIKGDCELLEVHGPVAVTPEEVFTYPWKYEDATISLDGNVTDGVDGPFLVTGSGNLPVVGAPDPGPQQVTGRFVLDNDLRYVLEVG